MIYLFRANNLIQLASKLAKYLKDDASGTDPFLVDWVVVQNKETQNWLQTEISKINGISANLKFVLPSELAWQLVRIHTPDLPFHLPTDQLAIQSRVFDFIIHKKNKLAEYGVHVPEDVFIALNLSESIADVFDLYQVFRPKMLYDWAYKQLDTNTPASWQAYIWQNIITDISNSFPDIPNRFKLKEVIEETLNFDQSAFPNQIHVFGLSHWSRSFFEIIKSISKKIDIKWYDQNLLNTLEGENEFREWVTPKIEVQKFFEVLEPERLMVNSIEEPHLDLPSMIKIHSCHNSEREVQVLKNNMLVFLDRNEGASVNEILVMVPDFDTYAPIIENEFKTETRFPSIPVFIPNSKLDISIDFILKLMRFYQNGEKVTDFFELINHIQAKHLFELGDLEINFFESVFVDMHIHCGLSTNDGEFSIEKGINQLALSFCMANIDYEMFRGNTLINLSSSSDVKVYISKLVRFHRILISFKRLISKEYDLLKWLMEVKTFLQKFLEHQSSIYKIIEKLIDQLSYSIPNTKIPFIAFHNWFIKHLTDQSATSTRNGTGITISSYIPYRNLPFKFVAILGLNEGIFPRNLYRPDFDLINNAPMPGDRVTKQDDALLFLERVYSTRDYIHLSYIGEGEKAKLPSILIQKLITKIPDLSITSHPLHSFRGNVLETEPFYTNLETEISDFSRSSIIDLTDKFNIDYKSKHVEELSVEEMIVYFNNPTKHLLNNCLGLRSLANETYLKDRESYVLTGLEKYFLKEDLAHFFKKFQKLEKYITYGVAKGNIPRGANGTSQLLEQNSFVQKINNEIKDYFNLTEYSKEILVRTNGIKIYGTVSNIFSDERVIWKINTIKPKELIELWICHLLMSVQKSSFKRSKLIGFDDKKEVIEYKFDKVSNPQAILDHYVSIFFLHPSIKYHWCCIPSLAQKYVELPHNSNKQLSEINRAWFSTQFSFKEDGDYYNQLLWRNELPWENDYFGNYATSIWEPLKSHLKVKKL